MSSEGYCLCCRPAARALHGQGPVSLRRISVTSLRGKGPARFLLRHLTGYAHPYYDYYRRTSHYPSLCDYGPSIATFCLLHSMRTRFVDKQSADHRIPPIRIETVGLLSLHPSTASHHVSVSRGTEMPSAIGALAGLTKFRSRHACLGLDPSQNSVRRSVRFPKSAKSHARCARESPCLLRLAAFLLHTPDWPTILVYRFSR